MDENRQDVVGPDTEVVFGGDCCFCGQEIRARGPDPLEVMIRPAKPGHGVPPWQMFWCHLDCFRKRLSPEFTWRYGGVGNLDDLPES